MLDLEHDQRIAAEALLARHTEHKEPYFQEFEGLDLIIDPDVFNPAYTNVTRMFSPYIKDSAIDTVLDMFEGSGVLGLLAGVKHAKKIVGVDISPSAVSCATKNGQRLAPSRTEHRMGSLWDVVADTEKFDLIVANPPLLPVSPNEGLEYTIADSPEMELTTRFIQGIASHLTENGRAVMSLSNTSARIFGNPVRHFSAVAARSALSSQLLIEKDVKYEIYRIMEFKKRG